MLNGRIVGGAGAIIVQALLLYALLFGLTVRMPVAIDRDLAVFGLTLPPPPPPVEKPHVEPQKSHRKEGAASPANLRSKATDIVAPKPQVQPIQPPPIVIAPIAGIGLQASTGAAPVPGPGTGAGGTGAGTGSGRSGNGDGDGDFSEPVQTKGRLGYSDVRRDEDGPETLTVGVRFAVEIDGHVDACVVTDSSGDRGVDDTTCRLIEQRFRFKPSRDPGGRPVRSFVEDTESFIHRLQSDRDPR